LKIGEKKKSKEDQEAIKSSKSRKLEEDQRTKE
jgi:hypothetical protein